MKKQVNKNGWYAGGIIVLILILIFLSIPQEQVLLGPNDGTTTQFDFEGDRVGQLTTVNLIIDYDDNPNVPFVDIIQGIPQGFEVVYEGISIPRPDLESYFPGTNPIQFTKFAPLQDETLEYVIVADKETACPALSGNSLQIDSLYLAPPEESREITLGETELTLAEPVVIRTVSKSEVNIDGEVTAYLHIYPGCADSYEIIESTPQGWTILDDGGGSVGINTITWIKDCSPNPCENEIISYKVQAPSSTGGFTGFTGQYEIPSGAPIEIIQTTQIPIRDLDCTGLGACGNEAACQGEYSNPEQTQSCFNFEERASCTGRAGFYCDSACLLGDTRYERGDGQCDQQAIGEICCQDVPEQTCEQQGGYCVFDDPESPQVCPPGFEQNNAVDSTCNNGNIPEGTNVYPICCIQQAQGCTDEDGDGYDSCDPADQGDTDGLEADCDETNPEINPGAVESMSNPQTCADYEDNDCDGATDGPDPDCETICEGLNRHCQDSCEQGYIHYHPADEYCGAQGGPGFQCCITSSCSDLGGICHTDLSCGGSNRIVDGDVHCESGEGQPGEYFCCEYQNCLTLGGDCFPGGGCPTGTDPIYQGNLFCTLTDGLESWCCQDSSGGGSHQATPQTNPSSGETRFTT